MARLGQESVETSRKFSECASSRATDDQWTGTTWSDRSEETLEAASKTFRHKLRSTGPRSTTNSHRSRWTLVQWPGQSFRPAGAKHIKERFAGAGDETCKKCGKRSYMASVFLGQRGKGPEEPRCEACVRVRGTSRHPRRAVPEVASFDSATIKNNQWNDKVKNSCLAQVRAVRRSNGQHTAKAQ